MSGCAILRARRAFSHRHTLIEAALPVAVARVIGVEILEGPALLRRLQRNADLGVLTA